LLGTQHGLGQVLERGDRQAGRQFGNVHDIEFRPQAVGRLTADPEQEITMSNRRQFVQAGVLGTSACVLGCASVANEKAIARVVVVGGGFGGATAAKYIRKWEPRIEVTLVERNPYFVSGPISNLVLAGVKQMADITVPYSGLARHGVRVVQEEAAALDLDKKQVRLVRSEPLPYDRLVVAPGVDFQFDKVPGLAEADQRGRVLHAWKAGPRPPRCKIVIHDGNPDIVSKKGLFLKAWNELYPGIIEYRPDSEVVEYDNTRKAARTAFDELKADLWNIMPPQQAGRIAQPLISVNKQWVGVEFQSWEAAKAPGVHVIGDAIAAAPGMPKSGFMANNHAKVVADAVIARLTGQPIDDTPIIANTGYSFVIDKEAVHVASTHKWNAELKTLVPVAGAGGLSAARNELEATHALSWATNIWADTLG
jgi:hypothetical protein